MPNGTTLTSKPKGTLSAYEPGLRDKIAWMLSDVFGGGDRGRANYINDKVRGAVDLAPVLGDVIGAEDAKRSFDVGNYGEAALNAGTTLVGSVPGVGDAAAAGLKAGGSVAGMLAPKAGKWLEMFHGSNSPVMFDELAEGVPNPTRMGMPVDVGIHVTPDPGLAALYAGIDNEFPTQRTLTNGRIYPILADKGNAYGGAAKDGTEIVDAQNWGDPDWVEEAFDPAVWGGLPHAEDIVNDVKSGASIIEALSRRGFDSLDYVHGSPRMTKKPATMVWDTKRIIPRLSSKGLTLNSKMGKFPSFPIEDYDLELWGK